ncbi:multidrug transporter [Alkalihalobacillus alcalophilus ATCC 27647 = CGMCC 1.3604]|uniref:Multidrug efflux transporter n=1 Tax=Alkalihalobacillus alcalophilus ATCC 27647 = CGMCC 1.3604 TaxID=1218173 RepID=J8TUI2_ALKAL|nr:MFS transporter [Alkalihalobacillus alcalophilus]AFV25662.1 multidrug efflux transporter [Alkalihalobacillus alcalophilus ATCC 27647 = CGMCC 1.3604]KGA98824.1 multidrug transporter [Alkalihalobacillus alcalophilus ATCC 27647 = CGMCC 1.3604]MED1564298.1 MFS transporter [Alkalihalobacillus alcalophilus]THG88894.1 multidrug transporter [Alkalihalobacillus alcalophilus ATCC 27647 = CGMCC 1.3604]
MKNWKRNLWILVVCQFIVASAMTMIIPFLPLYLKELGVENEATIGLWTGVIFGANFLTAFLFAPFWGRMADRYGRKMMILRSGFGMALIIGLTGFATGPISLLLLRLLNGMVSGFIPASIGLVSTNTPKDKVGYALGILQSGAVAGGILGPLLGGLMAEVFGYRMIFFITGFGILIATLVCLFMVRENFKAPNKQAKKTNTMEDFKKVTEKKPVLALYTVIFVIQLAVMGINPLLSIYVAELTPAQNTAFFAGLTVAVLGFSNMMSSAFLGRLGDKVGAHNVLVWAMLGVAMISIPQAFVTDIWQLIVLRFMLGLCIGGLLPAVNTLIRLHSPEGMEGRAYGFSNSAMYLGNMLGPVLGGWVVSMTTMSALFLISAALLLMNVAIVKGKVLPPAKRKFSREKQRQRREAGT